LVGFLKFVYFDLITMHSFQGFLFHVVSHINSSQNYGITNVSYVPATQLPN